MPFSLSPRKSGLPDLRIMMRIRGKPRIRWERVPERSEGG
jgi:hypothetical protein